ncbi:MAG: LamG domain-containing protein, partial [Bacteroidaceae bacterium]|nr:LamG domain-containing protein [Bacteroidaceae bacterium]
ENFEVMGETNESAVQEEPALLFGGSGFAQSEARRNFADKNMTVEVLIKPDDTGKDMPIFSHGTDGKQLQLWLTRDKKLKLVVDDKELVSEQTINIDGYRQVALVVNNDEKTVTAYGEDFQFTMFNVTYSGYGPVIFGATNQVDISRRAHYSGRMLQGRIWNRAMDRLTLTMYAKKLLTGYEMGLTDYYPMNEGDGNMAYDEAQGAHLTLTKVSWALPEGMALKLDRNEAGREVKGMKIRSERLSRTEEQDYTLMFWFKADANGRGTLLSNGSGRATDTDARNKFFISIEGETLKYRTNGQEYSLGNEFSNNAWHHYAMTVNRSHQVASIYVDNVLKVQFATDSLGGMKGNDFYLGNMVWYERGEHSDVRHQTNALTGWIDGISLFEQALPPTLIKRYRHKSVGGGERGLVTFLGFNQQERLLNNDYVIQPYPLSQKLYFDFNGKETAMRDTFFVDSLPYVISHIDQNYGAPMQPYQQLRNLSYSYVGRNNQLLVNLDERDARINKRRIYVTVYDIPDMNGNRLISPVTAEAFVDRNPLRWAQKTYKTTIYNTEDEVATIFDINIVNNSGAPHTFTVDNLPKWLTVQEHSDIIDPKSEQILTFTVSNDLNVGNYDNVVYLTDEDGLSEPLMLNITVEGDQPAWSVADRMKQYSMSIVGRVQIGNDIVTDSRDIIGVFDGTGRCMGTGKVNYDNTSSESLTYLTVYDSTTVSRPLTFKLWHYQTGKTMVLTPSQQISFKPESFVGTTAEPIVLRAGSKYIQRFHLTPGWNWISMNVISNDYFDVLRTLSWFNWQEGDMITDETNNISLLYRNGQWISNKGASISDIRVSVGKSYRIKIADEVDVEFTGDIVKTVGDRTISVKHGWNSIGYTPMVNLPVTTALADYIEEAEDGDVIKSKTEFAMFTKGANGSRQWKGNLQYMKPGEGYMLYRKLADDSHFTYPYYEPNATVAEVLSSNLAPRRHARTMSLTAVAEGVELQEGDKFIAIADGEVRGETLVGADSTLYISIEGDNGTSLSFAIERDGEIIAASGHVLTYQPDAISGSPEMPTRIDFVENDQQGLGEWYSIQGFKLTKRPTRTGVYIFNGRKQVIK